MDFRSSRRRIFPEAKRSPGDCVDEANFARLLVVGKAVGHKGAEFFAELGAVNESIAQRDKSYGDFSCRGIRAANHSTFLDRRVLQQHCFDLGRRDGEAFVFDHLLTAVDDAVETFAVAGDNVARPIPAVAQDPAVVAFGSFQ